MIFKAFGYSFQTEALRGVDHWTNAPSMKFNNIIKLLILLLL